MLPLNLYHLPPSKPHTMYEAFAAKTLDTTDPDAVNLVKARHQYYAEDKLAITHHYNWHMQRQLEQQLARLLPLHHTEQDVKTVMQQHLPTWKHGVEQGKAQLNKAIQWLQTAYYPDLNLATHKKA
jgi:hypothetical protein